MYTFVLVGWLVFGLVMGTLYKSDLMAKLITPRVTLPFNSLEEMATRSKPTITLFAGTYVHAVAKVSIE